MTILGRTTTACLLVLALMASWGAAADASVAQLQAAGRLQVKSWLTPAQGIVPGQQVKLSLEIATDRWFSGGTRILIPEVPGLVILQTDNFASNSTEQRNGQSWVVQRWTLEIYPQRAGNFKLPAIDAKIKISGEDGSVIHGKINSPELQLTAVRPEALARAKHWVAAPQYSVSQTFDRALTGLAVGDAIEREIVFTASEVMAMMLPAFAEEQVPGLRAYPSPPSVENSSNRGVTKAERRERVTYIVEAQGEYRLPAQDFFWWDTRSGELQLLSLPAVAIQTGAGSASAAETEPSRTLSYPNPWIAVAFIGVLAVLFWLARLLVRHAVLKRITTGFKKVWQYWVKLRKPGLPAELNPRQ